MFKDRKREATRSCDFLAHPVVSIKEETKEAQMWLRPVAPTPVPLPALAHHVPSPLP